MITGTNLFPGYSTMINNVKCKQRNYVLLINENRVPIPFPMLLIVGVRTEVGLRKETGMNSNYS